MLLAIEDAQDDLARALVHNATGAQYEVIAARIEGRRDDGHPLARAFRRAAENQRLAGLMLFGLLFADANVPQGPVRVSRALVRRMEFGAMLADEIAGFASEVIR